MIAVVFAPFALAVVVYLAVAVHDSVARLRHGLGTIPAPMYAPSMSPSGSPAKATAAARPGTLTASSREGAGSLPH